MMDRHIKDFFAQSPKDTPKGTFHKVISLNDDKKMGWDTVLNLVPNFNRGWFELSHLNVQDRIEFTSDYWLTKLPYHPKSSEFFSRFFSTLDEIYIFITQQKFDDPYEACLVYSLKDNNGFFCGSLPASDQQIADLKKEFIDFTLPEDYLTFLQIHNGFSKTTDCTGLTKSTKMKENYLRFQNLVMQENTITTSRGAVVDPTKLIPFYESFGMPFFQCFWAEWYPEQEMGNVYYSGLSKTISDKVGRDYSAENMTFPTFMDWLMFYMERVT